MVNLKRHLKNYVFFVVYVFMILTTTALLSDANAENSVESPAPKKEVPMLDFNAVQKSLNDIKIALTKIETTSDVGKLADEAQLFVKQIDEFIHFKETEIDEINASLVALGEIAKPVEEGEATIVEDKQIVKKRNELQKSLEAINTTIDKAKSLRVATTEIIQQIVKVRQLKFKSQITTNTGSIFNKQFWQPIFNPSKAQNDRLQNFNNKFTSAISKSFETSATKTIVFLLTAATFWIIVRLFSEKIFYSFANKYIPFGRFRRSFIVVALPFVAILSTIISLNLAFAPLKSQEDLSPLVNDFIIQFTQLCAFCALITGLGRAFLANQYPSRRLVQIENQTAQKLRFFPASVALVAMLFGAIEIINNVTGVIVSLTVLSTGLSALFIALLILAFPIRIYHTNNNLDELHNSSKQGLIHVLLLLSALIIIVSVLIGYISLASFISYQTLWISLVFISFYFLKNFSKDFWQALFYPSNKSAKFIKQTLNLNDKLLEQTKIIITAVANCGLIVLLLIALLNGSFSGATTQTIFDKLLNLLTENGLDGFGVVPSNLINAIFIFIISYYILSGSKKWLSKEFLPKTNIDKGIAASLVTLYSNIGYVLILLFTLAALGIQWSNLAWIVSALSVGIGFGLQEIVKNFISGIILLTERPVKVGDSVGIAGIEGDIKRINVRATEIQLSDKSTVIVPNSQLIAQNVKNNSKDNPKGIVSIELNFPINSDPVIIKNILIESYQSHSSILSEPSPDVRFSQLNNTAMSLTVIGSVSSPRLVSKTKSDLLFIILKALREAEIYPST